MLVVTDDTKLQTET